jgi:AcrR family transcriptional regulator
MAAKPKPKHHEPEEDTRDRLLRAAALVFAEKGFGGATVKQIAERAGVNISLISYHFNGKEGIFRTLLEKFGRDRLQDAEKILTAAESIEDFRVKLRLWMQQFLRCHVEDAPTCGILHRENLCESKFMWEIFEGTFLKSFETAVKFFESARKKGLLRKDIDCMIATSALFGSLVQMGKNNQVAKRIMGMSLEDEKFRNHFIEQNLGILLHGITTERTAEK